VKSKTSYILNKNPLVIAGSFGLLNEFPDQCPEAIIYYHNPWYIHPFKAYKYRNLIKKKFYKKNIKIIFLTNELIESYWMRLLGLESFCINHNIHVCENIYKLPINLVHKCYDAVYTAALEKYKRIELSRKIKNLNLITYKVGCETWSASSFLPRQTNFIANSSFLSHEEVVSLYHQSHAGLALSAVEGAMYASMEYLLSGLPVVSTRSLGGRSHFQDPRYWVTVNANPDSVKKGVERAKKLHITPSEIREIALSKINYDRIRFAKLVLGRIGSSEHVDSFIDRVWGNKNGIHDIGVPTAELFNSL
jgi:glycosyltransferase involved in cell wall biosynthesis